jgi:hypothetical protein
MFNEVFCAWGVDLFISIYSAHHDSSKPYF